MPKLMLLGDEALAQGALDAGISGFYGYPRLLPRKSLNMLKGQNRRRKAKFTALGVPTKKPLWKPLWV